jgi:2-keto-4-pentenoate hydratase/2-oxohepta-3-ene-1,7-dioic acid hydratase in catechol pathway
MRLATLEIDHLDRLGVLDGNDMLLPTAADGWPETMLALIDTGPENWARLSASLPKLRQSAVRVPLAQAKLRAPIPRPRKNIMCLGLNYRDHAEESARAKGMDANTPEHPIVFTKNVTSVNDPHGIVPAQPGVTNELDWEVELGVIIGVAGRGIAREHALKSVFGYTVINDISARDLQFRHKQFFLGKSLDGSCPMGPVIVTRDEIPDPQNLVLRSRVNGEPKQDSSTRDMIFDVATIVSTLSQGMRLEPGDIIATGTPAGVGFARTPPEFLKSGDTVECEIEGIGRLRNRVV